MEYQIYNVTIDPNLESDLEVNFIGLVDRPAIERNFLAFNKDQKPTARFFFNEEKRIIIGPAMIADLPIYRKDERLGEYFVVFDKAAIRTIVEKFSAKGFLKNFNLFHDDTQQVDDVTIFNSFITDEALGIKAPTGFEDLADGSWFIAAKVNNDDVWARVKSGDIKGFSVEGIFAYVPVAKVNMSAEQMCAKILSILNETQITD
jgi:Putative phage serine protease XkdF